MKTQQIKIQVPKPCHEDWNKMTPKDKGAFCSSCEKVVVDFTKMSDRQIVDFLNQNKGKKTCGKFNSYQIDRKISVTTPSPNYYWRIKQFFLGLFVSLSFPGFSKSSEAPVAFKPLLAIDNASIQKATIKGVVKDQDGNFIAAAYVRVYQNGRITKSYAVSNEAGFFSVELPENYQNKIISLKVTAQNYTSVSVDYEGEESIEIELAQEKQILGKMAFSPIEVEEATETQGLEDVQEEKLLVIPVQEIKGALKVEEISHQKTIEQSSTPRIIAPCTSSPELEGEIEITYLEPQEVPVVVPIEPFDIDIMGDVIIVDPEDYMPKNITGSVVDENGVPASFATILIENMGIGTITDFDGNFKLAIPQDLQERPSLTLKVSYLGYEEQTIIVKANDVEENEIILNIALAQPSEIIVGMIISVPEKHFNKPSSFDANYQIPAWKEAGFSSRRAYSQFLKENR